MGYSTRPGTEIEDFWPDDSETEAYLASDTTSLQDILDIVQQKWPTMNFSDIEITAKKIHTHALYYDRYDPSDHTDFIVLTCDNELVKEYNKAKVRSEELEKQLATKENVHKKQKI